MTLQRRLLRAMLMLLGLAALAGVSTIFVPARDFLGRIALTLIAAAIAIAIALPASSRLDRERTRPGALALLVAIVPAFVLILLAIWIGLFGGYRLEWNFAGTAGHYVLCAAAGLGALALARKPGNRFAGVLALVSSAACFALGFVAIWIDAAGIGDYETQAQLWASAWLIFWCGIITASCLYGRATNTAPWRWVGVVAAIAALAMGLWGIWEQLHDPPVWFLQAFFIAVAVGVCNILNTLAFTGFQRYVALGTMAMVLASFAFATYLNITTAGFRNTDFEEDFAARLLAASCIISVCGFLAIVIFIAANRRALVTHSGAISEIKDVRIVCPRCATKCDAHVGSSRCTGCGLLFLLQLAEPRCIKCEYNLLDLKADRCPECGTPVTESVPHTEATS
ncbi:MAG: hypothetical protein KF691_03235 [Phycisphaeraceae bacterium]|nr:hypothetical protein [Phycisphaeraceae bacterium]